MYFDVLCANAFFSFLFFEPFVTNAQRFYQRENPNLELAQEVYNKTLAVDENGQPQCMLQYFHLDFATEQAVGEYGECQNFAASSCCHADTVTSVQKVRASQSCESNRCDGLNADFLSLSSLISFLTMM